MSNIKNTTQEHEYITFMHSEGFSNTEIARDLKNSLDLPEDVETIRKRVSKFVNRHLAPNPEPEPPQEKPTKVTVSQNLLPSVYSLAWNNSQIVKFALVSDFHCNSKYCQPTHLHEFYEYAYNRGVKDFFNVGDIDEGDQMRPGHFNDCYNQGADDHVKEIVRIYPQIEDTKTYFILGNHDASIMKRSGHDIGPDIEARRPDMKYLGFDCAIINLTPNCTLELRHPWDATAYAISYKPQKMIDAIPGGEKPNILAIGHYHKAEYLCYRNVHCFQAGTFCAQTPFMRGKGISAMMGGWIISVVVAEDGSILSILPEFVPYYKAIPEDYKNWRDK